MELTRIILGVLFFAGGLIMIKVVVDHHREKTIRKLIKYRLDWFVRFPYRAAASYYSRCDYSTHYKLIPDYEKWIKVKIKTTSANPIRISY